MEKKNFVYLAQTREFIRLNEYTYKIGKTEREPHKRLSEYPKGTRTIMGETPIAPPLSLCQMLI